MPLTYRTTDAMEKGGKMTKYSKTCGPITFKIKEEPFTGAPEKKKFQAPADCQRCVEFDIVRGVFTVECLECKRYYADRFQERK